MTCESAQQNIILAQYGELADELQFPLEQHLGDCEDCRREWKAYLALNEELALAPMLEPSPNLLAASRMRLDEALDEMPARSISQSFVGNAFRWLSFVKGSPALATLLLGCGFLGGNILTRYQVVHADKLPRAVILSNSTSGAIASVSGIVQTPNSELVQVNYNRLVPETVQGSLDDPQIRQLLMLGTKLATNNAVHADSVALVASACKLGLSCGEAIAGSGVSDIPKGKVSQSFRSVLLASLQNDSSPEVRMQALQGLQRYVAEDARVRNGVLDALMHDESADVRAQAIASLEPVQADSSVRQVLRTVSSSDVNPAIRTASYHVLQGSSNLQ